MSNKDTEVIDFDEWRDPQWREEYGKAVQRRKQLEMMTGLEFVDFDDILREGWYNREFRKGYIESAQEMGPEWSPEDKAVIAEHIEKLERERLLSEGNEGD